MNICNWIFIKLDKYLCDISCVLHKTTLVQCENKYTNTPIGLKVLHNHSSFVLAISFKIALHYICILSIRVTIELIMSLHY